MNRLFKEKSPYLREHASDPVDWYPWGKEAFEEARRRNKPILLSIGYSSCHWCHVMQRESFSDPELASLLNDTFVCIKVDREERPDLDEFFMDVCVKITESGGWPLTLILTPEGKPFFAGTYIPKENLRAIALKVREIWERERDKIFEVSEKIRDAIEERIFKIDVDPESLIDQAYIGLKRLYDPLFGGFGGEPKFPSPCNLFFLLRYYRRKQDKDALSMVSKQLRSMRWGGIYDQVGGGIHRYSVDRRWTVPHFEKMLYDQALVSMAYIEAYQVTGDPFYKEVSEDIFEYVINELRSEDGGFYTSEDAESEGIEGKYYTWTEKELKDCLNEDEFSFVKGAFGIKGDRNILSWRFFPEELSKRLGMRKEEILERWNRIRLKLQKVRSERVHPKKDKKILSDINALMIASLSLASSVFEREDLLSYAMNSWQFIKEFLWKKERLMHSFFEGEASIPAFLDDYSFLGISLFELYEATYEEELIHNWIYLTDEAISRLWDKDGGFFYSQDDPVIGKRKVFKEGSLPSGQAAMVINLLRLFKITGKEKYREMASKTLDILFSYVKDAPWMYPSAMIAADLYIGPGWELTLSAKSKEKADRWIYTLRRQFFPEGILLFKKDKKTERTLALLCQDMSCNYSISDLNKLIDMLMNLGRRK